MSDHVVKTCHGSDEGGGPSNYSYQSVWMAHWMGTSYGEAAPPAKDYLYQPFRKKEDGLETEQQHLESGMEIHSSSEGFKKLGGRISEIMNWIPTNGEKLKNSFPMCLPVSNCESKSLLKNDQAVVHCQASRTQTDLCFKNGSTALLTEAPPTESSSKKQHIQSENNQSRGVISHMFFREKDFADHKPLQNDFTGSILHIVPHGFDYGENKLDGERTTGSSFVHEQQESKLFSPIVAPKVHLSNTNLAMMEHERRNDGSHSAFLVYEKKMDIHTGKSPVLDLELKNRSPLWNDPSINNNISPMFVGEQYQWMQNCCSKKLFQSQGCPPKLTNLEKLHYGSHSMQKIPHFGDVETMRMCSTPNSRLPGCPPRFSQTIHRLLITKKADVDTCKENQILRESRVSRHFEGSTFDQLHSFSPFLVPGSQGSGFHPLEVTNDDGGNGNVRSAGAPGLVLKNESSTETDTMDMNAFRKNEFSANSSSSIKDVTENPDIQFQSSNASAGRKVESVCEIPDINSELPALPSPVSLMDDAERSSSRTQSLDMEQLCSHADQPSISDFNHQSDCRQGQEPGSSWIKRLKLTVSDSFGLGTKISNMGDSSHEKVNNLLSKTVKANTSGSEEAFSGAHHKELMAPDRTAVSLRIGEPSFVDTTKGCNIVLSHPWIQRWCHKVACSQKNPETVVICEPQCSKLEFKDLQKKQIPSIAAMALMGKAMRGFQPCEFQNKGSFVVWNTNKGF